MNEPGDLQRANAFAEAAVALMTRHKVAPTPRNFTVWYTHVAGEHPELSRTLEILISNNREFSESQNGQLYRQFFSGALDAEELLAAGTRLDAVIARLLSQLGAAGDDAARYQNTLTSFSSALSGQLLTDMQVAVEAIVAETRRMAERNKSLERQLEASSTEISTLRQDLDDLRRVSLLDPLTGAANRKCFDQQLRQAAQEGLEHGAPLALIMIDIDHFKQFNDMHGHQLGDEVLRLVVRTLNEHTKGRDLVARYGGEEFAIILSETSLDSAMIVAEQLRQGIGRKRVTRKGTGETLGTIALSLGVAQFSPGEPLPQFVARADQALYLAKRTGRNRVASETDLDRKLGEAPGPV